VDRLEAIVSKNIVICCDGTNNEFGKENTSVVRLVQTIDRDATKQRLYYDGGLGTLPEPGAWTRTGKWVSKVYGLAFGAGLFWKTGHAYEYLMDLWEPGDRVFLFGFSRGAYTARLLAAVLHQMGLLPSGNKNLIPYVMRVFKALPKNSDNRDGTAMADYFKLADQFRSTFARQVPEDPDERHFHIHFLGLWDTVSSVGWVWDPPSYPYTTKNPGVHTIRHAVSIDERRWFFLQNLVRRAHARQDICELWFAGSHADVGGGYPENEGGLWRRPFMWMLGEAQNAGLLIDEARLKAVLERFPSSSKPYLDDQHESLTMPWWPAEFFPKLQWRSAKGRRSLAVGLGRGRRILPGALIDQSALHRLRERSDYRPRNMSSPFVERVRNLAEVPASFPYQ
jgi:uncharacterized protein (DUF2235 family)